MTLRVDGNAAGMRLDDAVRRTTGGSLRGARRLVERKLVLVNGRERPAHYRLRPGDEVHVLDETPDMAAGVRIAALAGDYVFLHKPAGLHSAMVSGSGEPSLERVLAGGWPGLLERFTADGARAREAHSLPSIPARELTRELARELARQLPEASRERPLAARDRPPLLLTRLDAPTSGLLVAAVTEDAAERFRAAERAGDIRKFYLATVCGHIPGPLRLTGALDTDKRRVTRVLPGKTGDETRHTLVFPLPGVPSRGENGEELVLVMIRRGARHQIRAHLAEAGYPLAGDITYNPGQKGGVPFFLCHICMELPEFTAVDLPSDLPPSLSPGIPHDKEMP